MVALVQTVLPEAETVGVGLIVTVPFVAAVQVLAAVTVTW
jgi:hypothetical protein